MKKKTDNEAVSETQYEIDFAIDENLIGVNIRRQYSDRENLIGGALFLPNVPDKGRLPGIVTAKKLLDRAIHQIVVSVIHATP